MIESVLPCRAMNLFVLLAWVVSPSLIQVAISMGLVMPKEWFVKLCRTANGYQISLYGQKMNRHNRWTEFEMELEDRFVTCR